MNKLQINHYRNISMDPLRNGGGSFGFPGPHFGNHWYIELLWCFDVNIETERCLLTFANNVQFVGVIVVIVS